MAAAVHSARHDVSTTLNYYAPIGTEPPYRYARGAPEGVPITNIGTEPRPAVVHDVRGQEDTVSLDTTGFQFVKHVSAEKDFVDDEKIRNVYYKEVEELLKKHTGAKRVYVFDHTIRRNNTDSTENRDLRGPVERVHIDQTFEASVARVRRHLGDDAERLLKSRVRIINVWRPIGHAVAHKPLAVADWRTLNVERDLVSSRLIYPDYAGSNYTVRYNPQLKWHYLADQTPEEVTLIKCFDSDEGKARLTPHTAFLDKTSPESAPSRQSIEVRSLIFDAE